MQVSFVDMESLFAQLVTRIAFVQDDEDSLSAKLTPDAQRLIEINEVFQLDAWRNVRFNSVSPIRSLLVRICKSD